MKKSYVLTLTGHDRVGIVDQVTKIVLKYKGNVDSSRMAHLGGEFAMLMLISVSNDQSEKMVQGITDLINEGYHVTVCPTEYDESQENIGSVPFTVEVRGADHEGIIHHIAHHMASMGINVESMDTNMVKAPMSGTPLFMMSATVLAPKDLSYSAFREEIEAVGDDMNVDVEVTPYRP